jgi:uncharacterized membrane protein
MVQALAGASTTWAFALAFAPLVASRAHAWPPLYEFSVAVYGLGAVVCHQLPARSFRLWGAQMPVCARCAGIYAGAALAAVVMVVRGFQPAGARKATVDEASRARAVLLAAALPSLATLVFEWTTGQTPSNTIRAAAGVPLGAAVSWLLLRLGYEVN